jgi:adenylyltransferase/sulfurtransferase
MEAIKLLAGLGEPLLGRLLTCDLRDMSFRKVRLRRDPNCAVCGQIFQEFSGITRMDG